MLFLRLALSALLGVASAAPAVLVEKDDTGSLSNAERVSRGMGVRKPARLYDPSRTRAPKAKRSAIPGLNTASVAFVAPNPVTKRAEGVTYASVVNGELYLSEDEAAAAIFTLPDTTSGLGELGWVPAVTEGQFTSGQSYPLYAVINNNNYADIGFGEPPSSAVTQMFAAPSYEGGLVPLLETGLGVQEFIWVVDGSNNKLYLAPDLITALQYIPNAQRLLPVSFTPGTEPNFVPAQAPEANTFANAVNVFATSWSQATLGWVNIGADDILSIASMDRSEASTFFVPDYATNAQSVRLLTNISGQAAAVKSTGGPYAPLTTELGTTTSLRLTLNPGLNVMTDFDIDGERYISTVDVNSRVVYASTIDEFVTKNSVDRVCYEFVPVGTFPSYQCAAFLASLQDATYGTKPVWVYASTASKSVDGLLSMSRFGKYFFPTTGWGINYDGNNGIGLFSKVGVNYYTMTASEQTERSLGPIIGTLAGSRVGATDLEQLNIQVPDGTAGIIKPPVSIGRTFLDLKFYYSTSSEKLYAFESDAAAQAVSPDLEELCIEQSPEELQGPATLCAAYFQSSPAAFQKNPVQLYARAVEAGVEIAGWLRTDRTLGARDDATTSTWYFPGGTGTSQPIYNAALDNVNQLVVLPGTQTGLPGPSAQVQNISIYDTLPSYWTKNWVTVPSFEGGLIEPQFTFQGQQVTWIWAYNGYDFFIFPNEEVMLQRSPNFKRVCLETVAIGQEPTGACAAAFPV